MGDSYRKPAADGYAERSETPMELLRLGNNGQNHADVLRDFHSLFNNPEKEWEIILSEASGAPPLPTLFD